MHIRISRGGQVYLRCSTCDGDGPHEPGLRRAMTAAGALGWRLIYICALDTEEAALTLCPSCYAELGAEFRNPTTPTEPPCHTNS